MSQIIALPQVVVELDGAPLPPVEAESLSEVRVIERLSLPSQCEITFTDPPSSFLRHGSDSPGRGGTRRALGIPLQIMVQGHSQALFRGSVTALEYEYGPSGGTQLRVRGYDSLHRLRRQRPVRTHTAVTLPDLARRMVENLGIEVTASNPGPLWQRLIQFQESDLEFLAGLAQRCALYWVLREDILHLVALEGIGEPVELELGKTLLEARIEINDAAGCSAVSTSGWDPWHVEEHRGRASTARVSRRASDVVESLEGAEMPQRLLVDEAVQDDAQAEALAQGELDVCAGRELTLWGIAEGNPRLRPATPVEIGRIAPPLGGRYVLTSVTHSIDKKRGFTSEISTLPPAPRPRPTATMATWGTVSRVDDPERLGRVQARLPAYGEAETDWMEVVLPGAGPGKGLFALPEVKDQVLLLFPREDPAQAMVLGGLYGRQGSPSWADTKAGSEARAYIFLTPGGQRLQLDDRGKRARLEVTGGSYLELNQDQLRLHARSDLVIEAPGRSVTIRGKAIDFEEALE